MSGHRIRIIYYADTGGNDAYAWKCSCFRESRPIFETQEQAECAGAEHADQAAVSPAEPPTAKTEGRTR
jgi:hypothetical protein